MELTELEKEYFKGYQDGVAEEKVETSQFLLAFKRALQEGMTVKTAIVFIDERINNG